MTTAQQSVEFNYLVTERLGHIYGSAPVTQSQRQEVEEQVRNEMEIVNRRIEMRETRYE
jgi:hypothetical protein